MIHNFCTKRYMLAGARAIMASENIIWLLDYQQFVSLYDTFLYYMSNLFSNKLLYIVPSVFTVSTAVAVSLTPVTPGVFRLPSVMLSIRQAWSVIKWLLCRVKRKKNSAHFDPSVGSTYKTCKNMSSQTIVGTKYELWLDQCAGLPKLQWWLLCYSF